MEEKKNCSVKIISAQPFTTEQLNQIAQILSKILPKETIIPSEILDKDNVLKYEFTKQQAEDFKNELEKVDIKCSIVKPTNDVKTISDKPLTIEQFVEDLENELGEGSTKYSIVEPTISEDKEKSAETKKCPFCAEKIKGDAKFCKWCHQKLTKKKLRLADPSKLLYVLIALAFFSFFLPFDKIQAPIVGSQYQTGFRTLLHILTPSEGKIVSNTLENIKDVIKGQRKNSSFEEDIFDIFTTISVISGVLAYVLLIAVAIGIFFKKHLLTLITSMCTCILSIFFMLSMFGMDYYWLRSSIAKDSGDNPFVDLFMGGVKMQPSVATYLLILTTFLIFIISWRKEIIINVINKISKVAKSIIVIESSEDSI